MTQAKDLFNSSFDVFVLEAFLFWLAKYQNKENKLKRQRNPKENTCIEYTFKV